MATSVIPGLLNAMVTNGNAAAPTGTSVYRVGTVTDDPEPSITLGTDDLDNEDLLHVSDSTYERAAMGKSRMQKGVIYCAAQSTDGSDMDTAINSAQAMCTAFANQLLSNPTQGVPSVLETIYGDERLEAGDTAEDGMVARIYFTVGFTAYTEGL